MPGNDNILALYVAHRDQLVSYASRILDDRAHAVVEYCAECWKEIRHLWIAIGPTPPSGDEPGQLVEGQPGFAFAGAMLPQTIDPQQRLWLTAEGWDQQLHQVSWPIGADATSPAE